ncbi:MAG: glycosyltransferase family 2 protein [Candidatus Methanomethyliaceae archaeon]
MSKLLNRWLKPKLSVVIPARNEEKELPGCLESLARQTFPDFEVIVVDNGSTDATAFIAKEWGARVVFEARRGPGYAREAGFCAAEAEIIASTDADTLLSPDWVARIHQAFEEHPEIIAVFGPIRAKPFSAPTPLTNALLPVFETGIICGQKMALRGKAPLFSGANFAVRKEAFFAVHGFRSPRTGQIYSSSEDILFGLKLGRIGRILYLPNLVVWTSARRVQVENPYWAAKAVLGCFCIAARGVLRGRYS